MASQNKHVQAFLAAKEKGTADFAQVFQDVRKDLLQNQKDEEVQVFIHTLSSKQPANNEKLPRTFPRLIPNAVKFLKSTKAISYLQKTFEQQLVDDLFRKYSTHIESFTVGIKDTEPGGVKDVAEKVWELLRKDDWATSLGPNGSMYNEIDRIKSEVRLLVYITNSV